jgi:hypothetical protein
MAAGVVIGVISVMDLRCKKSLHAWASTTYISVYQRIFLPTISPKSVILRAPSSPQHGHNPTSSASCTTNTATMHNAQCSTRRHSTWSELQVCRHGRCSVDAAVDDVVEAVVVDVALLTLSMLLSMMTILLLSFALSNLLHSIALYRTSLCSNLSLSHTQSTATVTANLQQRLRVTSCRHHHPSPSPHDSYSSNNGNRSNNSSIIDSIDIIKI